MVTIESYPKALQDNIDILSPEEKLYAEKLLSLGQAHLFTEWEPAGWNDDAKHTFFKQVSDLDTTPGGLEAYVQRSRVLLASAKAGENPFDGWVPQVPTGVSLTPVTPEYEAFDEKGIPEIGYCGFVLVAGGLGERLGYNGIKISLPAQTVTSVSYIEHYCQQILTMQARYARPDHTIPFAIMVSEDTEEKTRTLLESKSNFGMAPGQITLLKQGKVPALLDNEGHIALESKYEIIAKPHGHGDVHSLLYSTGTAEAWSAAGVRWVVFFQDTNGLGFYTLPAMLGVSVQLGLEVNSMTVDRAAKQAIGSIARLVHTSSGREMTVNVEYNQLDPLLRATGQPEGDVNDPTTGLSPFPGNINHLLFRMEPYLVNLRTTRGVMPEFVNPKYADSSRSRFKKPTRLECMMQDYVKLIPTGGAVGFTTAPAWLCYSPAKNNPVDAAASLASGVPASAPFTAECDQFAVFARLLRLMGANIGEAPEVSVLGITGSPSPRLVFHPSFALFPHELRQKFPSPRDVSISATSSLVLTGEVVVERLALNGALSVAAGEGKRVVVRTDASVENEGHAMVLLDAGSGEAHSEVAQMRGYRIVCREMKDVTTESISGGVEKDFVFAGNHLIEASALETDDSAGEAGAVTGCEYLASALNC